MKIFKYLIALVAGAMAFTACEKDPADLFSADATAPVMDSHADILLTENSVTETLTFSWKAARNMGDQILYTLYATLEGQEVALGTTEMTYISAGKEAFREKLLTGFGLSGNDNFSIGMYVAADNGAQVLKSEAVSMNVYVYGDYVPAVVSVAEGAEGGIVLTDALTEALTFGVEHTYEAVLHYGFDKKPYDAYDYLTRNIDFLFDNEKHRALQKFWDSGVKVTPRVNPG